MNRHLGPIALVAVLLVADALPAQFLPGPVFPAPGLSINYAQARRNAAFGFSYNRGFGIPYGAFYGPYAFRSTTIIVQQPPVFLPPPVGVLIPAGGPIPFDPEAPLAGRLIAVPDLERRPPPEIDPPLPGREAGVFRPLAPDNRDRARLPVPPAPPKPEPKKEAAKEPPPAPKLLPDPNPLRESERLIEAGLIAFARSEHGRAAERFAAAGLLVPNDAKPKFLLAQAHIALGNHRRAFDTLQAGLRLDPRWPRADFRPIELYGEIVADHADHVQALDDVLAAMPDDPVIVFLNAYQLWFDGRRDEAKTLFLRVAPVLPDPALVDRFLEALPPTEVL